MAVGGYAGGSLHIDLTTNSVRRKGFDEELTKKFIGGLGVAAWLAYDLIEPRIDPLSPGNVIIISAGPLLGTPLPAASKTVVLTKFPQTGAVAPGKAGGRLGPALKWAGYDHLTITGRAETPVYLKIFDNEVEICDANSLWGRDVMETTDELWERHGRECCVVATGPAGENRVKISLALVDRLETMGKGGLGAVMGSKNLKAVVVKGGKGVRVASTRFQRLVYGEIRGFMEDPLMSDWVDLGTMSFYKTRMQWYRKNYTEIIGGEEEALYGPEVYIRRAKREGGRIACPACPGACKDYVEVKDGEFKGFRTLVSTLGGRVAHFGHRCNVGGFDRALVCIDLANKLGVCAHNLTALVDCAAELFERGVLTEEDTGGLRVERNFPTTLELIRKTAYREGFGDLLAEGYAGLIERLGKSHEDFIVHIKGLDINFDPRINRLGTSEFHQVVNPRGGHQQVCLTEGALFLGQKRDLGSFRAWCEKAGLPAEAVERIFEPSGEFNVARFTRWAEDWWALVDSVGWGCYYHHRTYRMDKLIRVFREATGIEMSPSDLLKVGERTYNVLRAANVREGFTRDDDAFPERWFEPMVDGRSGKRVYMTDYFGRVITRERASRLLNDYYDERGWDPETGIPRGEKLMELNLGTVAEDLEGLKP